MNKLILLMAGLAILVAGCQDPQSKKANNDDSFEKYGQEYADYVDIGLQNKYKYLGLSEVEIYDKLKLVRKINRTFHTYVITDPLQARKMFNQIIGIYE